jgi:hypothetical protein
MDFKLQDDASVFVLSELLDALLESVYASAVSTANLLVGIIAALAAVGALGFGALRWYRDWKERNSAHVVLDRVRAMSCDLVVRNVGEAPARNVRVEVESGRIGKDRTGGMLLTTVDRIEPGAPVVFSGIEQIGKGTTIEIYWEDDDGGGKSGPHPIRECESAAHRLGSMEISDLGPGSPNLWTT